MNITVIYSTGRKAQSCTYNIARLLIRELLADDELLSFSCHGTCPIFAWDAMPVSKDRSKNAAELLHLPRSLCCHGTVRADHLLHPNLCVPCSGQMKILLDHFAYRWLIHRPDLSFIKAGRRDQYSRRWRHEIHRSGN